MKRLPSSTRKDDSTCRKCNDLGTYIDVSEETPKRVRCSCYVGRNLDDFEEAAAEAESAKHDCETPAQRSRAQHDLSSAMRGVPGVGAIGDFLGALADGLEALVDARQGSEWDEEDE